MTPVGSMTVPSNRSRMPGAIAEPVVLRHSSRNAGTRSTSENIGVTIGRRARLGCRAGTAAVSRQMARAMVVRIAGYRLATIRATSASASALPASIISQRVRAATTSVAVVSASICSPICLRISASA